MNSNSNSIGVGEFINPNPGIYFGDRNESFKTMILNVLKKYKVKKSIRDILTTEENLTLYGCAFTSDTADINNNYEVYEQLGDVSCNKALVSYFYTIFPFLKKREGVKVVARLRINYASKDTFAEIAEKLGFLPYISASYYTLEKERKSLLEDVFEAFIGVTESIIDDYYREKGLIGIGYACIYKIITGIFETKDISLDYSKLYDAKTRLKEVFDMYKNNIGNAVYEERKNDNKETKIKIFMQLGNDKKILSESQSTHLNKSEIEQVASEIAINKLRELGYEKKVSRFYNEIKCKERVKFELKNGEGGEGGEGGSEKNEDKNEDKTTKEILREEKRKIILNVIENKPSNINNLYFTFGKSKYRNKNNYKSTILSHFCKLKDFIGMRECIKFKSDINCVDTESMTCIDYLIIGCKNLSKKEITKLSKIMKMLENNFNISKNVYDNYYKYLLEIFPNKFEDFNINII